MTNRLKWTVNTIIEGHVYNYSFEGILKSEVNGNYVFIKENNSELRVPISRTVAVSEIVDDTKKTNEEK